MNQIKIDLVAVANITNETITPNKVNNTEIIAEVEMKNKQINKIPTIAPTK
jgi:hypothetical protein